jgi:hypothetical protein
MAGDLSTRPDARFSKENVLSLSADARALEAFMFNRGFLSSMFRNFIGLTAALGLTLGAVAPVISNKVLEPEPSPAVENSWRLLPGITYENITLFPVVSSGGADTSAFLTLDEGLASGEVVVTEQGSDVLFRTDRVTQSPGSSGWAAVNQLVLINGSKRPLLLLAGELVSGGKQDRIIGKDRIVPVGADPLPLDVFCVEHGRWSSGSRFSAAKTMVHPSVREQAALAKDQNQVWSAVRAGSTSSVAVSGAAEAVLAAPMITADSISESVQVSAPTQAYSKIYEDGRVGASVDEMVSKLERRFEKAVDGLKGERVVGVIVAYGRSRVERHLCVAGAVQSLLDEAVAQLLRGGVGSTPRSRSCDGDGCARVSAPAQWQDSRRERAERLPVARDYRGAACFDRAGRADAEGHDDSSAVCFADFVNFGAESN